MLSKNSFEGLIVLKNSVVDKKEVSFLCIFLSNRD